jgi:hypothetical protein
LSRRRNLGDQSLAQMCRHGLGVLPVQAQLFGDLAVGEVQPHEGQAQNPNPQRLMVSRKNGACQVIKASIAVLAPVALAMTPSIIVAVADH